MINRTKPKLLLVIVALILIGCGGGGVETPVNGGGDPGDTPEPQPASTQFESSGSGYSAYAETWNCGGLEGTWQLQGEITMHGLGTVQTDGVVTFTMPPRPGTGPWDSQPFSYTMSGTLYPADDVRADVTYEMIDVVNTIIVLDGFPTLMDSRGSGTSTVTLTGPDFSYTVTETYDDMVADVPGLIVFGSYPGCD